MWARKLSQKDKEKLRDNATDGGEESETKTEGDSAEPAEPSKLKPKNSLKALMSKVVPKGEDGALRWKTLKDMAQEGEDEALKSKIPNLVLTIFTGNNFLNNFLSGNVLPVQLI